MAAAAAEGRDQVLQGEALSTALHRVGLVDVRQAALVKTGESTGELVQALSLAVRELALDLANRQRLRAALAYPAVLGGTAAVSIGVILFVVLPRYAMIIRDLGVAPTGASGLVLTLAEALANQRLAIVAVPSVLAAAVGIALTSRTMRERLGAFAARLPLVAPIHRLRVDATRARAIGTMLNAGIPVDRCLMVLLDHAMDSATRVLVRRALEAVESGKPISDSLAGTGLLPASATAWLRVSDRTGGTAAALLEVAEELDAAARARTDAVLVLLQPLIVLGFGGLIAAVASLLLRTLYGITPSLA